MSAEAALAKLERRVLSMGGLAPWLKTVGELRKLWAMGDPDVVKLVLALTAPSIEGQVLAAALDAFAAGATDAVTILSRYGLDEVSRTGRPSKEATAAARGLDKAGRDAMAQAHKLAKAGAVADAVLAPVFAHANRVTRTVSDVINRAGNEGTTKVADRAGLPTVWVAETNACVQCLAYSGRVAKPGEDFPAGLTFGRRPSGGAVVAPPRHPNCRCTVEPLNDASYAAALRREAHRSVLRGFSLQSESMATRVDAADRLLAKGVDAPKSVLAYARRAIKAGEFPTRGRPR